MLFSYIFYFLVVLFLYLGYMPAAGRAVLDWPRVGMMLLGLLAFGLAARRLVSLAPTRTALNRWENRLTGLALLIFGADVYALGLKELIHRLPSAASFTALDGLLGLACFYLYLVVLWLAAWPAHRRLLEPNISLPAHLIDQLRWTLPLITPWFVLSLTMDLIEHLAPPPVRQALSAPGVEMALVGGVVLVLSLFLPPIIRFAWGCRPLPAGPVRDKMIAFLAGQKVKVRDILIWPLMHGRMLTAGIMGLIPPLRYLLVTPALINALNQAELEAVLAHEAGHVKHRHLISYLLFFLGYLVLAFTLGELAVRALLSFEGPTRWLIGLGGDEVGWVSTLISLPMLLLLIIYFRFIFAFFMRHFERQADAYAAQVVGPGPVMAALNRIALLSGLNRHAPSWHHFSIAQRVGFLAQLGVRPLTVVNHRRRLRLAWVGYVVGMALIMAAAWPAGFFSQPEQLNLQLTLAGLERALAAEPRRPQLHLYKAMILYRLGELFRAAEAYERVLALAPNNPTALNDLAWLYATGPKDLRRPDVAVKLAEKAVTLSQDPAVWDTLAEAYFQTGRLKEAVEASRNALARRPDKREYYDKQLEKFERALRRREETRTE